jgi:hypothetical protein
MSGKRKADTVFNESDSEEDGVSGYVPEAERKGAGSCESASEDEDNLSVMGSVCGDFPEPSKAQKRSLDVLVEARNDLVHIQRGFIDLCWLAGTGSSKRMKKLTDAVHDLLVPRSWFQEVLTSISKDMKFAFKSKTLHTFGKGIDPLDMYDLHMLSNCGCQGERRVDKEGSHFLMTEIARLREETRIKLLGGGETGVSSGQLITLVNRLDAAHADVLALLASKVTVNERQEKTITKRITDCEKAWDSFKTAFDSFECKPGSSKRACTSSASSSSAAGSRSSVASAAETIMADVEVPRPSQSRHVDVGGVQDRLDREAVRRVARGGPIDPDEGFAPNSTWVAMGPKHA